MTDDYGLVAIMQGSVTGKTISGIRKATEKHVLIDLSGRLLNRLN